MAELLNDAKCVFIEIKKGCPKLKSIKGILGSMYAKFKFKYFDSERIADKQGVKSFLRNYLNDFKFIVYKFEKNTLSNIIVSVICIEGQCLIIKNADYEIINQILKEIQAFSIDVSSLNKTSINLQEEIFNCKKIFTKEIKDNELVNYTIDPIITYLIRRFFYPQNLFKDKSFFYYGQEQDQFEQKFKNDLSMLFNSKSIQEFREAFPTFSKIFLDEFDKKIKNYKSKDAINDELKKEDFIELRPITASIKLVMNTKNFYIYAKKIIFNTDSDRIQHEKDFVLGHSHRCITRFYSLINQNNQTEFIYEFMSNGDLSAFLTNNKEKMNKMYCFVAINRIFQGISYIHSESMIHRDLKPLNILVDHDFVPYISDFDTIRNEDSNDYSMTQDIGAPNYAAPEQNSGGIVSYHSDIYSFGLLIYFLFKKKDYFQKDNASECDSLKIEDASEKIVQLFNGCIKKNSKERMTKKEIVKILISEMKSFDYLEYYLVNENERKKDESLIIQYFYENIIFLLSNSSDKSKLHVKLQIYYIYVFLNIIHQKNDSEPFYVLGDLYLYGDIRKQNYEKAQKCYEMCVNSTFKNVGLAKLSFKKKNYEQAFDYCKLSSEQNNWEGNFLLGKMYYQGKGTDINLEEAQKFFDLSIRDKNVEAFNSLGDFYYKKEDYLKAKKYYELAAQQNDSYGLVSLGDLYYNGFGFEKDYLNAKEKFELAIKQNDASAFNNLGFMYFHGDGVKQNYSRAISYYKASSYLFNPIAFVYLADIYYSGIGAKKDIVKSKECLKLAIYQNNVSAFYIYGNILFREENYLKAKKYYELAVNKKHSLACENLGYLYNEGFGVDIDLTRALNYYELSAKYGNKNVYILLGELYYYTETKMRNFSKAKEYFELAKDNQMALGYVYLGNYYYDGLIVKKDYLKAKEYYEIAEQNSSYGSLNLAKLYYTGHGVEKDLKEAFTKIQLAADKGNWIALINLGIIYYIGLSVKKSIRKAEKIFQKAIKNDNQYALLTLGILYYEGKSIDNNYQKAKEYFELSSKQNNSYAMIQLGKLYSDKISMPFDFNLAKSYFEKAAKLKNYNAFVNLGDLYLHEKQDFVRAKEYYDIAASQNNSNALLNLGLLYFQGKGVKQDYNEAKRYFELSAIQNNSDALYRLGILHYKGKHIPQDYKKAREFFNLSFEKDNLNALYYIGKIYENGNGVERDVSKAIECYKTYKEEYVTHEKLILNDAKSFIYKSKGTDNYYRAMNDLGLIYATEKKFYNLKFAEYYLKEAGLNKYPIGKNNLGLFYQFYLKQIKKAEQIYTEVASENHLVFTEYNIGHLKEISKKKEEMIKHFILASEYEKEPFLFRNSIIDDDKRLEISKAFIVILANLKIVQYYLTQDNSEFYLEKAKVFFLKAVFQPLFRQSFHQKNCFYQFELKEKDGIFINLNDFFLNMPMFNFERNGSSSFWNSFDQNSNINLKTIEIKHQIHNNFINKIENYDFNQKIEHILRDMCFRTNHNIINTERNACFQGENEIKFKFENDKFERSLQYTNCLLKIFQNLKDYKDVIGDIIEEMEKILYIEPYYILFGRIKINKEIKQASIDINQLFYDGFDE